MKTLLFPEHREREREGERDTRTRLSSDSLAEEIFELRFPTINNLVLMPMVFKMFQVPLETY